MARPIRSLDDLARKGFDQRQMPVRQIRADHPKSRGAAMFRARKRSEDWQDAPQRGRCAGCERGLATVKLAAYPATPPEALAVIRQAALQGRERQPSRPSR